MAANCLYSKVDASKPSWSESALLALFMFNTCYFTSNLFKTIPCKVRKYYQRTVKLSGKERFDKKQIGVKVPLPLTNLPVYIIRIRNGFRMTFFLITNLTVLQSWIFLQCYAKFLFKWRVNKYSLINMRQLQILFK